MGRQGRVHGSGSEAVLERFARDNLRVRRYHVEPGQTVHRTVAPEDDVVTAEYHMQHSPWEE